MAKKLHGQLCALVAFAACSTVVPVGAQTLYGTTASSNFGQRASFGGVTTVGSTTGENAGGEGFLSASVNTVDSRGSAAGEAMIISPTPLVRGRAQSSTGDDVARGNAAINGAYRFDSAVDGIVTFDYSFTATQSAPSGSDTFMRAQGALLSDVTDIYYGRSQYFEGGGTLEDSFRFDIDEEDPGTINITGSMSMNAEAGQIFNVLLALQTSAGGAGAVADSFSTLTGTLSSNVSGAGFTVIPEPSSLALLSFGGLLIARRKRG
ncbi:MAG: PEP-CTERM sorting domain-containing protein [Luteolibacter sp.]